LVVSILALAAVSYQAWVSRDTARRQLRAYVCVTSGEIAFVNPNEPTIEIRLKNCGLTPAYAVKMWVGLIITAHPLSVDLDRPPAGFTMNQSVLAPEGIELMHPIFDKPIPPFLLATLGSPQTTLYVYGQITYKDAFKRARFTDFRMLYGGPEHPKLSFVNGTTTARLKADNAGNDAN
jgi:hypothetical protein